MTSPPATVTISVSVVSGADPENILTFVESAIPALENTGEPYHLVAIVNGPDPILGSALTQYAATSIVCRPRPIGFAANHNEAMRMVSAQYYVVANDDVVVQPDALRILIDFLQLPENRDVAVVSPRLLNPDGTLQPSTYSFPTIARLWLGMSGLRDRVGTGKFARRLAGILNPGAGKSRMWEHDRQVDVETLRGAFVVVRQEAILTVGLMDEVSLVGGEETEWHFRMRQGGWRIVFFPEAAVRHIGSATVGGRPDLELEYLKGALNFFIKHRSRTQQTLLRTGGLAIHAGRWCAAVASRDTIRRRVSGSAMRLLIRPRVTLHRRSA